MKKQSFGINLSPIQLNAFRECLSTNADNKVTHDEFVAAAVNAAAENNKKYTKPKLTMKMDKDNKPVVEANLQQLEVEAKSLKKAEASAKVLKHTFHQIHSLTFSHSLSLSHFISM